MARAGSRGLRVDRDPARPRVARALRGEGDHGLELGEAESVRGGLYRFQPDLNWEGANSGRVIATNRVGFNSNRWLFNPGSELVFRHRVGNVPVVRPTDGSGARGWYPDPLPPPRLPLALRAKQNQPLWLTVHAGHEAAAGEHRGEVVVRTDLGEARVPLVVTVHDFDLPKDTHLQSALGLGMQDIARYHRLTNRTEQVAMFEQYLTNFAEHRISPYSFYDHAPPRVVFQGEGTNLQRTCATAWRITSTSGSSIRR